MKLLFLNPPAWQGFDGGAGSRYVAAREVTSYWYPTWLCHPAATVENSRVIDAPVQEMDAISCAEAAKDFDVAVIYTSTPTFSKDVETARILKGRNNNLTTIFVGPHVTVSPENSIKKASGAIDIICRGEFDLTIKEIADGADYKSVQGITYFNGKTIQSNPDRGLIADLDSLPFVSPIYARDLPVKKYIIPHFLHPYLSIYTSRGCPSSCVYCLWPQTMTGRKMRCRSPENVFEEVQWIRHNLPFVKEIAFDDDTFTADRNHAIRISKLMKNSGVSWAVNARVTTDRDTLKAMREGGLRHVVVGFESGSDRILKNIKKGASVEQAEKFVKNCKEFGISIHGAFVMGLPGETKESINETIEFAKRIDINSIQASIASPYPGTEFYEMALSNDWISEGDYLDETGHQNSVIRYPHLSSSEIFSSVDEFYSRFYFRPKYIARSILKMIKSGEERKKLLKEGGEYLQYMRSRSRKSLK